MIQEEARVSYGEGRYKINIYSVVTADGVSVTITGGEKPHVGGTVLSVPRLSLSGEGLSCDTWVIPLAGHKDTMIAVPTAEMICLETGQKTSVTAGVHIDHAQKEEINLLMENCRDATRILCEKIKNILGD